MVHNRDDDGPGSDAYLADKFAVHSFDNDGTVVNMVAVIRNYSLNNYSRTRVKVMVDQENFTPLLASTVTNPADSPSPKLGWLSEYKEGGMYEKRIGYEVDMSDKYVITSSVNSMYGVALYRRSDQKLYYLMYASTGSDRSTSSSFIIGEQVAVHDYSATQSIIVVGTRDHGSDDSEKGHARMYFISDDDLMLLQVKQER